MGFGLEARGPQLKAHGVLHRVMGFGLKTRGVLHRVMGFGLKARGVLHAKGDRRV
jgi:hypothetical protein